jgi:hypothetical protein
MAIGTRVGSRGAFIGSAIGSSADDEGGGSNPLAGVSRDATSGIYVPATAAEWATVLSVAGIGSGGPASVWGFQDASGNLADSVGASPLTVTGVGAYQQAVPGWTRLGIQTADAGTFRASTAWPTSTTASVLALGYITVLSLPAASRELLGMASATGTFEVLATGVPRTVNGANTGPGTVSLVGAVVPCVLRYVLSSTLLTGFSLADKMNPTAGAITSAVLGDILLTDAATQWLYGAAWTGTPAEMSDAQVKTLLQTLGWEPTWT